MRNYEKYTFYKEVWNKSFPSNWELLPLYALGKVKSITEQTDLQLLSVYLDAGVIPFASKAEKRTNVTSKYLSKYQRVDPGDFVLNNQQAWRGSVGVSFDTGIVSPAYIVLEMNDKLDPRFANYLFRARIMVDQYLINSKSVGSIQRNIYWPALKRTRVPVPSHSEQEQIIRYLDWKISGINGLINLKKKEIENLKELRNSAIDDGILHGFHTGDMKDSDIYWLGDIPSTWEVMPIKRVAKINASVANIVKVLDDEELLTFLPMENVSERGEIDCSIKRPLKEIKSGYSSFAKGDVVVAKITPCFENGKGACLDTLDTEIGFGTTEFINLRPGDEILSRYLYMITMTQHFRKLGERVMTGSAGQKRISANYIKNFTLGIPAIKEQEEILKKLDSTLSKIDELIEIKKSEISGLHELKNRLISDVVTGNIDVRDIEIPEYEFTDESADSDLGDVDEEQED